MDRGFEGHIFWKLGIDTWRSRSISGLKSNSCCASCREDVCNIHSAFFWLRRDSKSLTKIFCNGYMSYTYPDASFNVPFPNFLCHKIAWMRMAGSHMVDCTNSCWVVSHNSDVSIRFVINKGFQSHENGIHFKIVQFTAQLFAACPLVLCFLVPERFGLAFPRFRSCSKIC